MCGICGFTGFRNDELLRRMTGVLLHRGPDAEGYFMDSDSEPAVSLGVRRLAVIDLETGNQPIFNEDKSVIVVLNGEIYNYLELRDELLTCGHKFRTNSDTEVLVHLYEEYGERCAERMRGMFAFALWDAKNRLFMLSRDHFGIKPVYYSVLGEKLYFASEIKSLLQSDEIKTEIDYDALDKYFSFLYIPTPNTIFKSIKKLPPASVLTLKNKVLKIEKYWSIPKYAPSKMYEIHPESYYAENIGSMLKSSVQEQKIADVPLGVFLSGGIDSSAIVAFLSRLTDKPVKTFSIGYGHKDVSYNETQKARIVAEIFKCEHHEHILQPDVVGILPKLVEAFDEPFADSSALPTFLISAAARKDLTVALTGIGGDELFAGYPRYLGVRFSEYYEKIPLFIRKMLYASSRVLPESFASRNIPGWIKRFARGGTLEIGERYLSWVTFLAEKEKAHLYSKDFKSRLGGVGKTGNGYFRELRTPDDLFRTDAETYLTDDLLCLADRASMANSLELRVPFLDVRLVEFVSQIPLAVKTKNYRLKYLLKKVLEDELPYEILNQQKMGFQVPLGRWLNEEISPLIDELLNGANLLKTGVLNPKYVSEMLRLHRAGRVNYTDQLYAMLIFELWSRNYKSLARVESVVPRIEPKDGFAPKTAVIFSDIIPQDSEGGSARVAWELAKNLVRLGDRVTVVTKGERAKGQAEHETVDGIEIFRYYSNPLKYFKVYKEISRGKIDYIIFNHPFSSLIAAALKKKIPAVYSFNSPWHEEFEIRARDLRIDGFMKFFGSFFRNKIEHFVIKRSSVIFTASKFMSAQLKLHHGLPSTIISLGVDTEKFSPAADRTSIRQSLKIPKDRFLLLTVRNLAPRMGLENLISAIKTVVQDVPDVFLIIVGQGYLKNNLESQIDKFGLRNYIRLEGFIDDKILPEYYRSSDLFVMPTKLLEGFGLVTIEALACGTPVIATPVGGNIEVVGRFDKSMLFDGSEPEDIAAGIMKFIRRYKDDMESLRKKCRSHVVENYSWDNFARRIKDVV